MTHRNQGIGSRIVWVVLGILISVFGQSWCENAWAQGELFVTDRANNSITVYARTVTGDVAPFRTLSGPATGLSGPFDLAVDTVNDELVVANFNNNSITVYSRTANGDTAPLRTLTGAITGLSGPVGLDVDSVNNELMVTNFFGNSVTVYPRTASGSTAALRVLAGVLTGLNFPLGLAVDAVNDELTVTNVGNNSVTVYPRTASVGTAPIRTLQGNSTGLVNPGFAAVTTTGSPLASVALDDVALGIGQTIAYQATLTPGVTPTQVDIYLGCLLPDGVTFFSLVQTSPGVIAISMGPSPVPFLSNVTLVPTVVQFSYQFAGFEPSGTYLTYARLAVAGSNPFLPANQLSLAIQPFQYTR